jgi:hypothetical protein
MRHLARRHLCLKRLYLLPSSTFRSSQRVRKYLTEMMARKHTAKGITIVVMGSIMVDGRVAFGFEDMIMLALVGGIAIVFC